MNRFLLLIISLCTISIFADEGSSSEKKQYSFKEWKDYFGTPVSTGPFPGVRSDYKGTNLMINLSDVNKGLELLIEQQAFLQNLEQAGLEFLSIPRLFLSGLLETDAFYKQLNDGRPQSTIELKSAKLAGVAMLSRWLTGYFQFELDNSENIAFGPNRVGNSRIIGTLNFICIGDLEYQPYFLTLGQTFVPFGQYTSFYPIQDPLTKTLFRTLARDATLSFYNETVLFSVFAFRGTAQTSPNEVINNCGLDIGLNFIGTNNSLSVGASLIRDINGSGGIIASTSSQSNGNDIFLSGLDHYVPGLDVRINLNLGKFTLIGEYCQALKEYAPQDYTFNGSPANLKAFDAEIGYHFSFFDYPAVVAVGYTETYEALLFNVPKSRVNASLSFNPIKDNIVAIEFNSDLTYPPGSVYGGVFTNDNGLYYVDSHNLGKRDYSIAIDYEIFF